MDTTSELKATNQADGINVIGPDSKLTDEELKIANFDDILNMDIKVTSITFASLNGMAIQVRLPITSSALQTALIKMGDNYDLLMTNYSECQSLLSELKKLDNLIKKTKDKKRKEQFILQQQQTSSELSKLNLDPVHRELMTRCTCQCIFMPIELKEYDNFNTFLDKIDPVERDMFEVFMAENMKLPNVGLLKKSQGIQQDK